MGSSPLVLLRNPVRTSRPGQHPFLIQLCACADASSVPPLPSLLLLPLLPPPLPSLPPPLCPPLPNTLPAVRPHRSRC